MRLFDAGMVAFAAWHALRGRVEWPLTFQVPRMLRATLRDEGPATYVLCWNGERLRKRELWPRYRDRTEIWDEAGQDDFDAILRVLSALGAVQYRADGWEADEALAALVHRLEGEEELIIHSDDKDFMQLLSPTTWMTGRVRGEVRHDDVEEILGVAPAFVADYLALGGDDADGIPAIVTAGEARALLEANGHVRAWPEDAAELRASEEVRAKVAEGWAQLETNLELVDLGPEAVGEPPEPRLEDWCDPAVAREIGERTGIGYLTEDDLEEQYALLREWGGKTRERLDV